MFLTWNLFFLFGTECSATCR